MERIVGFFQYTNTNVDLTFTTKTGAKEIDEQIVNAKQRVGGIGLAKEKDPGRHKMWLTAASWEIFIFR